MTSRLHFVGVAADQFEAAVRVWGVPDERHPRATWTVLGDIPGTDKVVLGREAFPVPRKWRGRPLAHDVE